MFYLNQPFARGICGSLVQDAKRTTGVWQVAPGCLCRENVDVMRWVHVLTAVEQDEWWYRQEHVLSPEQCVPHHCLIAGGGWQRFDREDRRAQLLHT